MSKGKTSYSYWTAKDKNTLKEMWEKHTLSEIASFFNKTPNAIDHMARKLKLPPHREIATGKKYKRWTEREKNMLMSLWGEKDLNDIANRLGRSLSSIKDMVHKLGLPAAQDASNYLTQREVARIMGVTNKKLAYWENKRKIIKFRKVKLVGKMTYKVITLENLIKVLEEHQDLWDSTKMDFYALGSEPLWLCEKRKRDGQAVFGNNNEPWTVMQEQQLYSMWRKKVPQKEMAATLGKTQRAIRHRIQKLRKEWQKREQSA